MSNAVSMYLKGQPATSQVTFSDTFTEVATDATGSVTVTIKSSDGLTTLSSGTATSLGVGTGSYKYQWTPTTLDTAVTITWSATVSGQSYTIVQTCDVVGAWPFTIAELRAFRADLDAATYPAATLQDARVAAIDVANRRLPTSLVPKFHRHTATGRDLTLTQSAHQPQGGRLQLVLPHRNITTLKSLTVDGNSVTLSTLSLNGPSGIVTGVVSGYFGGFYASDASIIVAEYEYGYVRCPQEFVQPLMMYAVQWGLPMSLSPRVTGYQSDFGFQRLAVPGPDSTGIPDLDAAIIAYGGGAGLGVGA